MIKFSDIAAQRPSTESLAETYRTLNALLDEGRRKEAIELWYKESADYESWGVLTFIQHTKNMADPVAKAAQDYADELSPTAVEYSIALTKRFLADPDRAGLEALVWDAIEGWEISVTTFDPAIKDDLEEEANLDTQFSQLVSNAQIIIQGQTVNMEGITPFIDSLDRNIRHEAEQAKWRFFSENKKELDEIMDRTVKLRHEMAQKLGYKNYIPLGYRLNSRESTEADIAGFRENIVAHIVPLAARIMDDRRKQLGLDHLYVWDETITDPRGNVKPAGNHDFMIERARSMYHNMHPRLGAFYDSLIEGGHTDLQNRLNKRGGGYCVGFPTNGMPFIFGSFNGTRDDMDVFTHEVGHAFQYNLTFQKLAEQARSGTSINQPITDLLWAETDACEIPSISFEFLCNPYIDLIVEDGEAERFRRMHLLNWITYVPHGACVDHFEHEIYTNPDMTPEERHQTWQRLEKTYMPWRDYGDLEHPAMGGGWQRIPHLHSHPLYTISYDLSLCAALQFNAMAKQDYAGTMEKFISFCELGGTKSMVDLLSSSGLRSPFEPGVVADLAKGIEAELGMASPFGDKAIPVRSTSPSF